MHFMSKAKVERLIQKTDQQFSHWNKRALDGFNPEAGWQLAAQPGVLSGLLMIV